MASIIVITDDQKKLSHYLEKYQNRKQYLLIKIVPKTKDYGVDQIKEIIAEIKSYHKIIRVYLFENFHNSSLEAQNSFLKTLEESSQTNIFILTTDNLQQLLPTLISRSGIIDLRSRVRPEINKLIENKLEKITAKQELSLFADNLFQVKNKVEALILIDQMIMIFESWLTKKTFTNKITGLLKELIITRYHLFNNNLNPQLAIDHCLIQAIKISL